ncbi:MAG: hypothetical protein ACK4TC_06450 [Sphingomonas pseudosanguinis]|uniref:hypothetical protein n=1 Tax=Sphingomonas pseudosanguinis TaxID=413712 RepID=UPI00391B53D2
MLPDWHCGNDEAKRQALSRFIIDALDAELEQRLAEGARRMAGTDPAEVDPARLAQFARALATSGLDRAAIDRIGWVAGVNIAELAGQAANLRAHGFVVSGGEPRAKPGTKSSHSEAFHNAAADVPRIRALFVQHWGRRNRTERPMAEEIAAERWQLSPEETTALIDRFQRKG